MFYGCLNLPKTDYCQNWPYRLCMTVNYRVLLDKGNRVSIASLKGGSNGDKS